MKRLIIVLVILFVFSISVNAQMGGAMVGEQKAEIRQPGMPMGEGMRMPMMSMMQMCQHMMGQHIMMRDMMHMMMDMMKMQQRMIRGIGPVERKEMLKEMDRMMERLDRMMSETRCMMRGMPGGMVHGEPKKEEQKSITQKGQEKSEAGVTVKVSLEGEDGALGFKISLDTHTVDLDRYKFDEIVVIRADGKEYKGSVKSQEGSGHHRSAIVEFDNPKSKEVVIVVKDVAGVRERVFKFLQ